MGELGDDGFDGYIPTTVDPGASILVATLLFCFLSTAFLPCFIAVGRRWQRRKDDDSDTSDDDGPGSSGRGEQQGAETTTNGGENEINNEDNASEKDGSVASAHSKVSQRTGISSAAHSIVNAILDAAPRQRTRLAVTNRERLLAEASLMDDFDRKTDKAHSDDRDTQSIGTSSQARGPGSVLGKLDHDAVSVQDAIDGPGSVCKENGVALIDETPLGPWWSPSRIHAGFDNFLLVVEWDYESKRIVKLGLPFITQSLLEGMAETIRVAIMGRLIGTQALSAYVVVDLVVGLTTQFMKGFIDGLTTLCSQAIGVGNKKLAGQYVQMTAIIFSILYIPFFVFWYYFIRGTLLWFGFDEETADIGQDFAILFLLTEFLQGLDHCVHRLLDVIGCENYSTLISFLQEVFLTVATLIVGLQPNATLQHVGYAYVLAEATGLVVNAIIVLWNGWFDPYLEGMIGSFALKNYKGLRMMLKTASALSFGYLLTDGEWEILTVFAGFLGPAEVAAWGVLGTLWDTLEFVTEAIAEAGEVRCAFLLGAGQPEKARMSAFKTLYLGMFATIVMTSCLFIAGDQIPIWMTTDATLQRMLADLIPLFGIGNIALSVGTVSWQMVGSQGRYRLATTVGFAGSWLVTIPLAAIMSIVVNFELEAQTAAIVIGYTVSGTINTYILFQSDWEKLSKSVIEANKAHWPDSDDDDDSSSSSDSSSDSDSSSGSDKSKSMHDPVSLYKSDKSKDNSNSGKRSRSSSVASSHSKSSKTVESKTEIKSEKGFATDDSIEMSHREDGD